MRKMKACLPLDAIESGGHSWSNGLLTYCADRSQNSRCAALEITTATMTRIRSKQHEKNIINDWRADFRWPANLR